MVSLRAALENSINHLAKLGKPLSSSAYCAMQLNKQPTKNISSHLFWEKYFLNILLSLSSTTA